MAISMKIAPNTGDSHQTSPAYMLTFLRFGNRDTSRLTDADFLSLRRPMLVINDCVQLVQQSTKKNHIQQLTMVMKPGDINYSTAVVPGDFVLVNMLDDDGKLFGKGGTPQAPTQDALYSRATNLKPINGAHDGFKGVFKIQSVRRRFQTNRQSGAKTIIYQITAAAFTEFNQVIYFNQYLYSPTEIEGDTARLNAGAHQEYAEGVDKGVNDLRTVFKRFVGFLIGAGFPANYIGQKEGVVRNHNKNFLVPPDLGKLLGMSNVKRAADIFNYYVGVQKYTNSINPILTRDGNFLNCGSPPPGVALIQAEPFGQVSAWSILNQYSNSLLNEMYTAFKLTPEGNVLPSVVYRQKPFSTKEFAKKYPGISHTEFLSLPRWEISPNLIYDEDLGRDEAARINFVHIVGKTRYMNLQDQVAQQASIKSFQEDVQDIQRNGLKPFISGCDFDFPVGDNKKSSSPEWNLLMFDWLRNGHLKHNGTIVCAGIHEPICVGDNLQIDTTVYHIEAITHSMSTTADGHKAFETTIQLSYGIDARSTGEQTFYPEQTYTDQQNNLKDDFYSGDGILPGITDVQDIVGRNRGEGGTTKDEPFESPGRRKAKSTLPIYEDLKAPAKATEQKYQLPDGIKDLVKKITK
jgi:hypothetical protein